MLFGTLKYESVTKRIKVYQRIKEALINASIVRIKKFYQVQI